MERAVVIGSDRSCDLPVAFDSVSSRHCRVILDNDELWVEDLDSTNGTYVDGQRLEPGSQQRLGSSSELDLGGEVTFTADEIRDLQSLNATGAGRKRPERRNQSGRNQEVEYVPSSGYAGFWRRVFASLVDGVLLAILGATVAAIIGAVIGASGGAPEMAFLVNQVIGLVAGWLYFAGFESSEYQATPGKLALGIKVSDMEGSPVGFGKATGRHFGKIISTVVLFIGYIMAGITEKKQALHDIVAGCLVINK